jgi:predicted Zn finger-like uncharacterized protein
MRAGGGSQLGCFIGEVMILTCPDCATSFVVDDSLVPPAGRKVKCSNCGLRWMARPEADEADEPDEPDDVVPVEPEEFAAADEPAEPAEEEPAPVAVADEPPAEVVPLKPRRSLPPPRPRSDGRVMVWAGAAAVAAGVIAAAMVFRAQVVELWPASSAAYAGLGLDVGGLVLEQVQVQPGFVDGRPILSVKGAIRNRRGEDLAAPPVRLTLLDRAGKPVGAELARPLHAVVPAHAVRHFVLSIADPPPTARDLEVRFATGREAEAAAHDGEDHG